MNKPRLRRSRLGRMWICWTAEETTVNGLYVVWAGYSQKDAETAYLNWETAEHGRGIRVRAHYMELYVGRDWQPGVFNP